MSIKLTIAITLEDEANKSFLMVVGSRPVNPDTPTHSIMMLVVSMANNVMHRVIGKYVSYLRTGRFDNSKIDIPYNKHSKSKD